MGTVRPRISLVRLLEDVGTTVLNPVVGDPEAVEEIASVVIHDPDDDSPSTPDSMVLLVGITGGERIAESVAGLAERGVRVVVARVTTEVSDADRESIMSSGVVVLTLARGVSWVQLTSLLHSVLSARNEVGHIHSRGVVRRAICSPSPTPSVRCWTRRSRSRTEARGSSPSQAARKKATVHVSRPSWSGKFLTSTFGCSKKQGFRPALSQRRSGVGLGRDPRYENGSYRRVHPGGDEFLGSMWVATGEPMSEDRMRALRDSAGLIALQMLRLRGGADAERRLRADLIATLLDGGTGAVDAMNRLGLGTGPALVMALGRRSFEGSSKPDDAAHVVRLTDALAMHLGAVHSQSAAALVNGTGYAVLSVRGHSPAEAELQAFRVASDFLDRTGASGDTIIGIGRVVTRPHS
ncbi:hypothetical protein GCM10020255_053160 [Rhodococcus baikonurensis]